MQKNRWGENIKNRFAPEAKSKSTAEIAQNYYSQALDLYKAHRSSDALKFLYKSFMVYPFYINAWALFFKSLIHVLFPEPIIDILKRINQSRIYFLKYMDFILFKQKYPLEISKDKTNVLFIVPHMTVGGGDKTNLSIAERVDRKKFSFHLIKTDVHGRNEWYDCFKTLFQNVVVPVKEDILWEKYFCYLIRKLNIKIVITCNSWIGYRYLPQLKSKFRDIKIVDIMHAEESVGALPKFDWLPPYLDTRICTTNRLKNYMKKRYESSGFGDKYIEKLQVIYNGIDLNQYRPNVYIKGSFKSKFSIPKDVKIITYIGRFSSEKNPLLFVEIAKNVIMRMTDYQVKFIMIGTGPDFENVRNLIDEYGMKDHIILTGTVDSVVEVLVDTYLLLVVSKTEGIPFVILEAMAMEVPVISTDVGGIKEVIQDNINGYLIDPETNVVNSFTDKIMDLLSGKSDYHALAKRARKEVVSKYSLEAMGAYYQSLFTELIS